MYGGGGGSVLLFDAGCPTPKQAWLLPRWGSTLHALTKFQSSLFGLFLPCTRVSRFLKLTQQ